MSSVPRVAIVLLGALLALAGCREPAPTEPIDAAPGTPAQAVLHLTRQLHDNDLRGFARDAVPPALHAHLDTAWREGRTRWPLDELPFGRRLPAMLQSLAAPDAEARLQGVFDRQIAGAEAQLHGTAVTLGLFGAQYVAHEADYSDEERAHYAQLVEAVARWGAHAPLGDRARARAGLAELTVAARATGLTSAAAFADAGMDASLERMGRFAAAFKHALRRYGLELDADLASVDVRLQQQTGDRAQVRMRYHLGGHPIDTTVALQRIDGRWYPADFVRHAEAAVEQPAAAALDRVGDNAPDAQPAHPALRGPPGPDTRPHRTP